MADLGDLSPIQRARVHRMRAKAQKRLDRKEGERTKAERRKAGGLARLGPCLPSLPAVVPASVVARESGYILRMAGTYVYGLTDHAARLISIVPPLREAPGRELPVLLVHGVAHNHSWALRMQTDLRFLMADADIEIAEASPGD